MEQIRCPRCGYPDLVRARVRILGGLGLARGACCVTCGFRFRVDRRASERLRYAVQGEPYGTVDDLDYYTCHFPMTRAQATTVITASVVMLVVGSWCAFNWGELALAVFGIVFLPMLYLSWWVGHWISPPKRSLPGFCPKCLYNLRGISGNRCPECGAIFPAEDA